jgi:N-acyl-D-aspartate/D-glutamate deacylase
LGVERAGTYRDADMMCCALWISPGRVARLSMPELVHDMPAGGRRFVQRVDGYVATLVAGQPTFEHGEHTGAMPGRLVRAGRNGAALAAALSAAG